MTKKAKVFLIKDMNTGELVFKGTRKEIMEHFKTGQLSMEGYISRGSIFLKKYTVENSGEIKIVRYNVPPKKATSKLEYLQKHLEKYGITILNSDPTKYIEPLKELGIEFTFRKATLTTGVGRKTRFYVLERI